jgi:hypothetical protein
MIKLSAEGFGSKEDINEEHYQEGRNGSSQYRWHETTTN